MSTAHGKSEDIGSMQIQEKDSRSGNTGDGASQYVENKRGRTRGTHQLESKRATGHEI